MHAQREFGRFLFTGLAVLSTACGGGSSNAVDAGVADAQPPDAFVMPDAEVAPVLFTPRDDLSDEALATQALDLLRGAGGPDATNCEDCHGLTRQRVRYWRAITDTSFSTCFSDLLLDTPAAAQAAIDCMRQDGEAASLFHAENVAIFNTGAHLPWFQFAFRRAYGDEHTPKYEEFLDLVGMPRGQREPFSQADFDVVASWFTRGVPLLDTKLPADPPSTECLPGVSNDVGAHVDEMALSGWRATNAQNNLLMFGCNGAQDAVGCLTSYPAPGDESVTTGWNVNVPGQLRILRENGYRSNFWTRSSADGRFVGHGASTGGANSRIVDLQRDVSIPGSAQYDPAFLPDNSGFMFQNNGFLCSQSLLVSEPAEIEYASEPLCSSLGNVGLYQHLGAAVDGGDYWSVHGPWVNDNGGRFPQNRDPRASFSGNSKFGLTPLIDTGNGYDEKDTLDVSTPYEGDAVLSTSARMVISRLRGPGERQIGYVMRNIVATPTLDTYDIEATEVARYCVTGGKPAFSYDDRWLVLHHYIGDADAVDLGFTGPDDPGFDEYESQAGSNIYLIDTLSGEVTRITNMQPGQYALFPHFRSDGWIYFMVRTLGQDTEHIVASDAALRLESSQ